MINHLFIKFLGRAFVVYFILFCVPLYAQNCESLEKELKSHVKFLSSDALRGRMTGGIEEALVNTYLETVFSDNKERTICEISYRTSYQGKLLKSTMSTCFQNKKQVNTVLVGAHVDHIGMGGELSKSIGKSEVHNGADDNASGVAMVIELQKYFSKVNLPFNILFVAYTGHEIGTKGSEYLAKHWKKKWGNCIAVINFDMIGRLEDSSSSLFVSSNNPDFFQLASSNMRLVFDEGERLNLLDTRHFVHLPCITFSTGIHSDYHKVSDDEDAIIYAGMCQQFKLYQTMIANLAMKDLKK